MQLGEEGYRGRPNSEKEDGRQCDGDFLPALSLLTSAFSLNSSKYTEPHRTCCREGIVSVRVLRETELRGWRHTWRRSVMGLLTRFQRPRSPSSALCELDNQESWLCHSVGSKGPRTRSTISVDRRWRLQIPAPGTASAFFSAVPSRLALRAAVAPFTLARELSPQSTDPNTNLTDAPRVMSSP